MRSALKLRDFEYNKGCLLNSSLEEGLFFKLFPATPKGGDELVPFLPLPELGLSGDLSFGANAACPQPAAHNHRSWQGPHVGGALPEQEPRGLVHDQLHLKMFHLFLGLFQLKAGPGPGGGGRRELLTPEYALCPPQLPLQGRIRL